LYSNINVYQILFQYYRLIGQRLKAHLNAKGEQTMSDILPKIRVLYPLIAYYCSPDEIKMAIDELDDETALNVKRILVSGVNINISPKGTPISWIYFFSNTAHTFSVV
jgi:hypothetical protein